MNLLSTSVLSASDTDAVRRRAALAWLLAAGVPLLPGCTGTLLPKAAQPPARFTLDSAMPETAAPTPPAGAPTLTVDLPRAAPGHDSRRMVFVRRPPELEAFGFHEWVEPPARMLAPLLVRALQDSGAFAAVLLAPSAAVGTWRLETSSLQLQQDFTRKPSQVRLGLRAVLLDSATREVLAWREFETGVDAAGDDPVSGAQAAQTAARQLALAVAAFCARMTPAR
ncbi:ABC-type transport auxiliary lipoprotein family protein [Hydrogenophaga sp. RWCD_12]|uniref:ABC-type transport auxiliary lipoprotein family protein n=1 Tax=Hydrogenophaga sp. RWCD_12 TaxID=3391190 RepID=UPI003984B002